MIASRRTLMMLMMLCAAIAATVLCNGSALALERHVFSSSFSGSGANALSDPQGVAVDESTGDVYVVDRGNNRVEVFSASGTFISAFGTAGSGNGQLNGPTQIAVDNSSGLPGDVYVLDAGNHRVEVFNAKGEYQAQVGNADLEAAEPSLPAGAIVNGIAVDKSGTLWIFDGNYGHYTFGPGGALPGNFGGLWGTGGKNVLIAPVFAIDSSGTFDPSDPSETFPYIDFLSGETGQFVDGYGKFAPGQVEKCGCRITALATDPANGDLYVDHVTSVEHFPISSEPLGFHPRHEEQSLAHEAVGDSFGTGHLVEGAGVAVDGVTKYVYVADAAGNSVDIFNPIILADATTEAASGVAETAATLNGTVNPDGLAVSSCRFEYGTEPGVYPNAVACSSNPGAGSTSVPVSAPLSGLTPVTIYYYRVAVTNANGANYGSERSFTTPGLPAIDGSSAKVHSTEKTGQTHATLQAQINPDGRETTYSFEYGETTSYGTSVPLPAQAIGAGQQPVSVPASELSGLTLGTTYHYRVVAGNEYGTVDGPDQTFTTVGAAALESESVTNVRATSATLQAQINPLGVDTSAYFQYGTASCVANPASCSDAPLPPGTDIGFGEGGQSVSIHLQGLMPNTLYHYRVLAKNALGVAESVEETFTTPPSGSSFVLPDGRRWELVSAPNKHGSLIQSISEYGVIQAAAGGAAFTYVANAPTETQPAGYSTAVQVFATRGPSGWSSNDIATRHNQSTSVGPGYGDEYRFFSPDLSLGLVEPKGPFTPLEGEEASPEATERTEYLRHDSTCQSTPSTCYTPLVTAANVPPGVKFGGTNQFSSNVHVRGASKDLSHVILSSEGVGLTSTPGDNGGLYEWAAGRLQPVSILPAGEGGAPTGGDLGISGAGGDTRHAVSDDGSRVFWTVGQGGPPTRLYMRDVAKGEAGETLSVGTHASTEFEIASSDGSRVFFVGKEKSEESGKLEVCDVVEVAGKLACKVTLLAPGIPQRAGVLGASEDGSYVYFVSRSVLASKAVSGAENLYADHDNGGKWEPELVATLSPEDNNDWTSISLPQLTSRVSPDGRWLAFMSQRSLTGYDNTDAVSGQPDQGVFLFNQSAGRLVCVSCNPTGGRPVGVQYKSPESFLGQRLVGGNRVWPSSTWLAANIPGWTPFETDRAAYQSRYLSNSGRLFFNSSDALAPQDVNGTEDVYQYEPPGIGGCTTASITFSERSGGCVGLISSGSSAEESAFLDASENGGDVFFLTTSKLVSQDFDTSLDVYDAHECAPASPCFAVTQVSPPACTTGDSCKPAPSPQPAIFGSPASATFTGAGNTTQAQPDVGSAQPRSSSSVRKLAKALRQCRKKPKRSRALCEARARKHYANRAKRGRG
jgi:DNA-binding beta-propeller fold protein YncE